MMKMVYLGILFAMTVLVVAFAGVIRNKKDRISKSIVSLFAVAIIAICTNAVFVMTDVDVIALLFHSAFLACIDWLLLLMLRYVYYYTEITSNVTKWMIPLYLIATVETISMLLNPIFHHVFSLGQAYTQSYGMYYYPTAYTMAFYAHLAFCYALTAWILVLFMIKIRKTARLYRIKYTTILIAFTCVIICDAVGLLMHPPIDISLIFYCAAAIVVCFFSEFYVPKAMTDKILYNALRASELGVSCFDISGKCIYINHHGKEMFRRYQQTPLEDDVVALEEYFAQWLQNNWTEGCEEQSYCQRIETGYATYHYEFTVQRLSDDRDVFLGSFVTCVDRSEEVERYEEEHYRATHDLLTGIYNEQYFEQKVTETICQFPDTPYILITSDIKDFKLVNDLFGTDRGDEILKMHATMFRERAGANVVYGRLAEDHFGFCMPKERFSEEVFRQATEELIDKFANDYFRIQIYMGVYEITDIREPVYMMIDKCNLAMAKIKGSYSRNMAYFDDSMLQKELENNAIINEFEGALSEGDIQIYLQAQTTGEGQVIGAEALARWIHPTRGVIPPLEFIAVLEEAGLIHKLDVCVWELAVQQLARWKAMGREDLSISVNISVQDQYHLDIFETFREVVERYDVDPHLLKLEITETIFITEVDKHLELIRKLQAYGFEVEIDDFGSGYSSLNILKDINADIIKIDMGFVQMTNDENRGRSQQILSTLMRLITQLEMGVIVEGVETKEQVDGLIAMGCNHFQGFYFARPIPVDEFEKENNILKM